MSAPLRSLAALLAVSLGACLPPSIKTCSEGEAECADTAATTIAELTAPTTSAASDDVQTATGEPETSSTGDTTSTPDATTAEPAGPPTIVDVDVEPPLIVANGVVKFDVTTQDADGVDMVVDGELIVMEPAGLDVFHAEIEVLSGSDNGKYTATLTPWRDADDGMPKDAEYEVLLPLPGAQVYWEAGDQIGGGSVVALDVLPDGLLVELGTFYVNAEPRCYLRRRQQGGMWLADDFIDVFPNSHCEAVDLKIDHELGTLYVLLNRKSDGELRWWLGEIASWGKGAKKIGTGVVEDTAHAVAHAPGVVAVCGAQKQAMDLDAAAWLHRPGQPVEALLFDWQQEGAEPHRFAETARDCVFANGSLVLVGEAYGSSDDIQPKRNYRFVLERHMITNVATWTVAGPGPGTQSRAFAVDVDDTGRYLVAGISCADACEPDGELRVYQPGGALEWQVSLGPMGSEFAGPHDIAWSPAGSMVVALAHFDGKQLRFKVEAYKPGKIAPLWTFVPDDKQGLQIALALAIGEFGEIYAGGIGAGNYPAVAYIGG
jgi:hypothetical protein